MLFGNIIKYYFECPERNDSGCIEKCHFECPEWNGSGCIEKWLSQPQKIVTLNALIPILIHFETSSK